MEGMKHHQILNPFTGYQKGLKLNNAKQIFGTFKIYQCDLRKNMSDKPRRIKME